MSRTLAITLALAALPQTGRGDDALQVKLAATLFGETVGAVELSLEQRISSTLRYRSDLLVIRDRVRLRSLATIESTFDPQTGRLVKSRAQRCTEPEDGSAPPKCGEVFTLPAHTAVPSLAAELFLARLADGKDHCLDVIDEESGTTGQACAVGTRTRDGVELTGSKLSEPFHAVVSQGLLVELVLPNQGARFTRTTGEIEVSDADVFAEPVPARGDPSAGIRQGTMRVQLYGMPQALQALHGITAPGQTVSRGIDTASLKLEVQRQSLPKGKKARDILDRAALMVAQARGQHEDCQSASNWFTKEAKQRRWKVEPAFGIAYVDGRFAFHQWVIVQTPDGRIPIDPLLAQVPADAGHIQLSSGGESVGDLLVQFRRGLSIVVE